MLFLYRTKSILTPIILIFFSISVNSCSKGLEGLFRDNERIKNLNPLPGSGGNITFSNIQENSVDINWKKATDDITTQSNLEYKILLSSSSNIITIEDAEKNGTIVLDWTVNIDTLRVENLSNDSVYYFNILVRDKELNTSSYIMNSQKTLINMESYIVFYPFTGNTQDRSSNNIDLNIVGAVLTENRKSIPNRAYNFDYFYENYLYTHDSAALNITDELTISVWVNLLNTDSHQKIIGKVYHDGKSVWKGYALGVHQSNIFIEIWDSAEIKYSIKAGSVQENEWTHLAFTWKRGGDFTAYINGSQVQQISASSNPISVATAGMFKIGAAPWYHLDFVDGSIDDIRIYDAELNSTEITTLYNLPVD